MGRRAPPQQIATSFQAARSWTEFQDNLLSRAELAALGQQNYPERVTLSSGRPEIHAVAQMVRVMEDAWVDLKLGGSRDVPMNRSWMTVFRRWAATPDFRRLWPVLRGESSQDFVNFCETHLAVGARVEAVDKATLEGHDAGFFDAAVSALDGEFAREWPNQPSLKDSLAAAEATWTKIQRTRRSRS